MLDRRKGITSLYNIEFHLAGRRNRKVQIDDSDTHQIRMNEYLAIVLGLSPQYGWYARGQHVARSQMILPPTENVTTMFVYCDILKHVVDNNGNVIYDFSR